MLCEIACILSNVYLRNGPRPHEPRAVNLSGRCNSAYAYSAMLLLYYFCQEIMREGNEKERDCSVSRINTYRVGVQSEKNFFCQELGLDLNYVSQVFLVEQMNYHKKMYEMTDLTEESFKEIMIKALVSKE